MANVSSNVCVGARTVARTVCDNSDNFDEKVGMHQGSALSPLLFVIVMEVVCQRV